MERRAEKVKESRRQTDRQTVSNSANPVLRALATPTWLWGFPKQEQEVWGEVNEVGDWVESVAEGESCPCSPWAWVVPPAEVASAKLASVAEAVVVAVDAGAAVELGLVAELELRLPSIVPNGMLAALATAPKHALSTNVTSQTFFF